MQASIATTNRYFTPASTSSSASSAFVPLGEPAQRSDLRAETVEQGQLDAADLHSSVEDIGAPQPNAFGLTARQAVDEHDGDIDIAVGAGTTLSMRAEQVREAHRIQGEGITRPPTEAVNEFTTHARRLPLAADHPVGSSRPPGAPLGTRVSTT